MSRPRPVSERDVRAGRCQSREQTYRSTVCCRQVSMRAYISSVVCAYPSTAPSFLPRAAYSLFSSTPAKTPCLPRMLPTNLTTPTMPPGTSTVSPTSISFPSAPILFDGEPPAPTNADSDACRAMLRLAFSERLGEEAVGWSAGRAPRRLGVCG